MESPNTETFPLDAWEATVSRTAGELRYSLRSGSAGFSGAQLLPTFSLLGIFVLLPGIILFRVGTFLTTDPEDPAWAVALTWVFAGLLAVYLLLMLPAVRFAWVWGRHRLDYVFTPDHVVIYGGIGDRILCPMADVRAVQVPVYLAPPDEQARPAELWADLVLVIGEGRQTFAWLVGFPADALRTLAATLHHRLNDFRADYGLPPLEPLEVIETTQEGAGERLERNPLPNPKPTIGAFFRSCLRAGLIGFLGYPRVVTAWCAAGIAGAVGAHRLLPEGAGSTAAKGGGLLFGLLLLVAWQYHLRERAGRALAAPPEPPADQPSSRAP